MAILSIQSHVSYGYVGNNAAGYALHGLDHEIWPVHTVLFSNHPGYGSFGGDVQPVESIRAILDGLLDLGIASKCDAVLSGYLGRAGTGHAVRDAVERIRRVNRDMIYVCDPVIGDVDEGIYVDPDVVDVFRDHLLPCADVITPNAFELSVLSGHPVHSIDDALVAARQILVVGPSIVIVTSVTDDDRDGQLSTLLVTRDKAWEVQSPELASPVKGAGDLLSALWLGRYLKGEHPEQALAAAVSSVYAIIESAAANGGQELPLTESRQLVRVPGQIMNLKLLNNKDGYPVIE